MNGIIIQARMGSQRLPGKIIKSIGKKTLLEHIMYRLQFLRNEAVIVIATTVNTSDDIVYDFCIKNHIQCYRGSEENVLSRYYECAKIYNFKNIVRLTGDNPFIDIEELDNLIQSHIKSGADYSYSFKQLPIGVGSEIFSFKALEKSWLESTKPNHFEHVNEYIEENPSLFNINEIPVNKEKQFPNIRLTVDTIDDYNKACYIVENASNEFVSTEEAVKLCLLYV